MSFDGDDKQWKCGKGGSVNLHKVSSIVRDIGEQPCLHHSPLKVVKVVIAVSNMLKPDKWQATFDSDGNILGFHRVLKSIILGGIDPSIRAEVWEFLLGCYALSSTTEYRTQLRTARRERYRDLLNQCQMMHSSIGTGSLAYPVGSKVMDMRLSSKDEGSRDTESQRGRISEATVNKIDDGCASDVDKSYRNREQNFSNACEGSRDTESQRGRISEATVNKIDDGCASDVDKSYRNREQNFSNASDLLSVRGSTEILDCSDILPSPDQRNCSSSTSHRTNELNFVADSYLDFPALPVTDLFTDDGKDKRAIRVHENKCSTRRKLRYEERHMHSFQINNNADLVVELGSHRSNENILCASSISEVAHPDVDPSPSRSKSHECEKEMINRLRISDAPETPAPCAGASQGAGSGDRVSEWLWTLHRIVVDVVRTDSHLDFYEDTKNLARMSDILAVYAWVDPETGYCQGMSDLLSPFVVLFEDNADAFWCFEMLIRRMRENFKMEGPTGVMKQLQALWHILELTDKEVFSHLSHIGAESLHFAFRMLLVLFRRELSFNEALCMWEMIWAADFDLSLNCLLEENCPEVLAIQLPPEAVAESGEESIHSIGSGSKGGSPSKHGPVERSVSDSNGVRSAQARPFCGLTKTFWSKNDRCQVPTIVSSTRNGDDELPVFCVAAILVMNRPKILKETRSIDDLIKIFNDNMLEIRVKRCIRTAIKLRKKYFYKLIRNRSPAAHDGT